jgi:hypothetical protein
MGSASGDLPVGGQVFAENLPRPMEFALMVTVNVTETERSVDELMALPEPSRLDD